MKSARIGGAFVKAEPDETGGVGARLVGFFRIPKVVFLVRTFLHVVQVVLCLVSIMLLPTSLQLEQGLWPNMAPDLVIPRFSWAEFALFILATSDYVDHMAQWCKEVRCRLGTDKVRGRRFRFVEWTGDTRRRLLLICLFLVSCTKGAWSLSSQKN